MSHTQARGLLLLGAMLAAGAGRADGTFWSWAQAEPEDSIALSLPADGVVLIGGFALWESSQALRSAIGPKGCTLCDGFDNVGLPTAPGNGQGTLNGVDAFFHDHLTGWLMPRKTSDTLSGGIAYVGAPLLSLAGAWFFVGPHASDWAGARAAVLVLESVSLTGLLGQTIKFGVARKRPWVRYGHGTDGPTPQDGSTYDVNDPDKNFSTFSGHASATAAATVSAAMTATLQDSRAAPYLWAGAGTLMFVTSSLRMMAEAHYFTDVLGGTALGAGVGVLLPLLHKAGGLLGKDIDTAGLTFSSSPGAKIEVAWSGRF